ncbi:MAG: hypothetical protein IMZ74_19720 [Actinobacteria bacterium]|nr:hypothetical protein [Actinomycetota bacterium]
MEMIEAVAYGNEPAVLEDASGRRARWMRRAGRAVFVLFLAWLVAIVLGGLGLTPVPGIPLVRVLRPSQGPPPLTQLPQPQPPSAADRQPALPAVVASGPNGTVGSPAQRAQTRPSLTPAVRGKSPGRGTTAPGRTKPASAGSALNGRSATAPGYTKPAPSGAERPGRSAAPGQANKTIVRP